MFHKFIILVNKQKKFFITELRGLNPRPIKRPRLMDQNVKKSALSLIIY